jgi:antitoxin component YwqK of YwqJK toxin-antitoxin module
MVLSVNGLYFKCFVFKKQNMLDKGFIYEHIISFVDYQGFKTLQCVNRRFYEHMDDPFYRELDPSRQEKGAWDRNKGTVTYYRNGLRLFKNFQLKVVLDGDIIHGIYQFNYYENVIIQCQFVRNKKHGLYEEFYNGGAIKLRAWYNQDKVEGEWNVYYLNGNPLLKCSYVNGVRHGPFKEFDINGVLVRDHVYQNGFLTVGT